MKRLRILMSAYSCGPGRGSEPGEGWNAVREASRRHDVTVITTPEFRDSIERETRTGDVASNAHFEFLADLQALRIGRLGGWLAYDHWQASALRLARRLHRESPFDLAHHVTFASWRVATPLHKLNIPVIWGPLGGGQDMPAGFGSILGLRGLAWEALRVASQRASRWDPRIRTALRRCAAVLAANSGTARFLEELGAKGVEVMCEMGLDVDQITLPPAGEPRDGPLQILWVGRLEHRKALPLLLRAMSLPGAPEARLVVVGDGPERARWQVTARRLGLAERVSFHGMIARADTLRLYSEADVFVFSSLRDSTGWVFVEAMASALPVIALDLGAAHDLITPERGFLVPTHGIEGTAKGLAEALAKLAAEPELRRRMGESGRKFVEKELTWTAYGNRIESVYRRVMGEGSA